MTNPTPLKIGSNGKFAEFKSGDVLDPSIGGLGAQLIGTPANGSIPIYNSSTGQWDAATLTQGTNVTITNAAGGITIASTGGGGGMSNPMTTEGDMIYEASGNPARLALGAKNTVLSSNGTDPTYANITSSMFGANILAPANGGLGVSATGSSAGSIPIWNHTTSDFVVATLTQGANITITDADGSITIAAAAPGMSSPMTTEGDMIYETSGAPARLALGGANTVLFSNGTDPGYGNITSQMFGTNVLAPTNGGFGVAIPSASNGAIPIWNSSTSQFVITPITQGANTTITNSAGAITIAASGGGGGTVDLVSYSLCGGL